MLKLVAEVVKAVEHLHKTAKIMAHQPASLYCQILLPQPVSAERDDCFGEQTVERLVALINALSLWTSLTLMSK